jgi:hypothetical protein
MAILFLCLHERHAINAQVGVQIKLHTFLTPEIDGSVFGKFQCPGPLSLTQGPGNH